MRWTLYGRVVDNFGDIGFCRRLAADLAGRGEQVRLAVDDVSALSWMSPRGGAAFEVVSWRDAASGDLPDAIVETFGCGIPDAARAAAAAAPRLPVHVDVEHLSAEPYALASHGLPSPHFLDDGRAWPTWFFYPGFTPDGGGLLRETSAADDERDPALRRDTLAAHGLALEPGERCAYLFGYDAPGLDGLLAALAVAPTLLLLAPGAPSRAVVARLGPALRHGHLRAATLPYVDQRAFDRLLRAADVAFVRGEDSPVRAIWAGVPFVWQLYPQGDGAHVAKLDAFLRSYLRDAEPSLAAALGRAFAAWNGVAGDAAMPVIEPGLFDAAGLLEPWRRHARRVRSMLAAQPDLTTRLIEFVTARRLESRALLEATRTP